MVFAEAPGSRFSLLQTEDPNTVQSLHCTCTYTLYVAGTVAAREFSTVQIRTEGEEREA